VTSCWTAKEKGKLFRIRLELTPTELATFAPKRVIGSSDAEVGCFLRVDKIAKVTREKKRAVVWGGALLQGSVVVGIMGPK